jgi:uncharacterized protein YdaU (DUF1376 family)
MSHDDHKPITFPVYIDRWIGGTMHLSAAARGIYFDLLLWSWAHDKPLPVSKTARARIARVSQREFDRRWHEISDKWSKSGQGLVSKPLQKVREKWADYYASQREKAKKGAAKRWEGHKATDAPGNAPGNAPSNAPDHAFGSSDLDLAIKQDLANKKNPDLIKKDPRADARTSQALNGKTHPYPTENGLLLLKLAHTVIEQHPHEPLSEWTAKLKDACGQHGIAYTGQSAHAAITQAEATQKRRQG